MRVAIATMTCVSVASFTVAAVIAFWTSVRELKDGSFLIATWGTSEEIHI